VSACFPAATFPRMRCFTIPAVDRDAPREWGGARRVGGDARFSESTACAVENAPSRRFVLTNVPRKRSASRQIVAPSDEGHCAPRENKTCFRIMASDRARGRRKGPVRCARTGGATKGTSAKSARGRGSASTGGGEASARSAGARRSASTGGGEASARSALALPVSAFLTPIPRPRLRSRSRRSSST
jgi:hypothetical protein